MSDTISSKQRSLNMSRIRSRNTLPELRVRSILHRSGFRFRLHQKGLPGKPDIVLRRHKTVVFVHGCFWHQHKGCKRCTTPRTNESYWQAKLEGNIRRDKAHVKQLRSLGWSVLVVWECETKDESRLTRKLRRAMDSNISRKIGSRMKHITLS